MNNNFALFLLTISIYTIPMQKFLTIISIILLSAINLQGIDNDSPYSSNGVFDNRIKSVQLYKEGWNLSYPALKLNGTDRLELHFDLLNDNSETYYYTFYHCDRNWQRSDIFTNEYLEGFPENPIEDYRPSFNTTVDYFHYRLLFPNDRVSLKRSGNYIIYVYPADDQENPVLTQRFIVTEDDSRIDIKMHRPLMTTDDNAGQQVDFTVNISGLNIIDPARNIYSFILQNGRWDNAKKNLQPEISGGNQLIYNSLSDKNIFIAGNEFRYFDIRNIKYLSENIVSIDFIPPNYHFYLKPVESRQLKPYFYYQDFNGKYYIATSQGKDADSDADYVYVYFTLNSDNVPAGSRIYVTGSMNGWSAGNDNLAKYNQLKRQYECTMLLKQGWYNYEYSLQSKAGAPLLSAEFEGSYYETENDYLVLVYYRGPGDRYDRLITTGSANTLNHLSY